MDEFFDFAFSDLEFNEKIDNYILVGGNQGVKEVYNCDVFCDSSFEGCGSLESES